jgi:hypothetical protein
LEIPKRNQNGQYWVHKTEDEDKQDKKHNTICVGQHCTQSNTNNVNKTLAIIQTTGRKDEPNIVANITTRKSERKDTVL